MLLSLTVDSHIVISLQSHDTILKVFLNVNNKHIFYNLFKIHEYSVYTRNNIIRRSINVVPKTM